MEGKNQLVGIFEKESPRLEGIKWGNWGSRPYEYEWVGKVVSVKGKSVIDLGVGLPSQYDWYRYVVKVLKPSFYAGIDIDGRILQEEVMENGFEIKYMDMSDLKYPDQTFDVAYCISTFEHIPYNIFMKSIKEAHRVLKDDGVLVITLDERWNKNLPITSDNNWNYLEQSVTAMGLYKVGHISFGLPDFLNLIEDYFVLSNEDAVVHLDEKVILSEKSGKPLYHRKNREARILNSGEVYNSCVSYAVLKKKK